jgi:hypothetical protein
LAASRRPIHRTRSNITTLRSLSALMIFSFGGLSPLSTMLIIEGATPFFLAHSCWPPARFTSKRSKRTTSFWSSARMSVFRTARPQLAAASRCGLRTGRTRGVVGCLARSCTARARRGPNPHRKPACLRAAEPGTRVISIEDADGAFCRPFHTPLILKLNFETAPVDRTLPRQFVFAGRPPQVQEAVV